MDLAASGQPALASSDVTEFVRFCYRRRRVGWPELYDEMCAVAGRGLFRGWRFSELADRGIGFGLSETPVLARITSMIAEEEGGDRRGRLRDAAASARREAGAAVSGEVAAPVS